MSLTNDISGDIFARAIGVVPDDESPDKVWAMTMKRREAWRTCWWGESVIPAKVLILGGSVVQNYPPKKGRGTEERKLLYLFLVKMTTMGLGASSNRQLQRPMWLLQRLMEGFEATLPSAPPSTDARLHRQRRGDKLLGCLRGLFSAPSSPSMPIQFVASLCSSFASHRSLQIGPHPDCYLPSFQCNNTFGALCLLA